MKILHICAGLPISNQSGIPNYVRGIAIAQVESGHDVAVLTDYEDNKYPFKIIGYSSRIKSFSRGPLVDKEALYLLKTILGDDCYDIIHIHMVMNIDWDVYEIVKDYKYVVSLHDYWFLCPRIQMYWNEKSCSKYDEKKCKMCLSFWERYKFCRGCAKTIAKITQTSEKYIHFPQNVTVSRYVKYKELLENAAVVLPVSSRVMEIYKSSGIDANYEVLHIGNITADTFKDEYSVDDSERKIRLVFLGRLTKTKGAEILIRLAKDLDEKKYEIHFFGDASNYSDSISEVGIINHGKYKQIELSKILNDKDIGLVLPIWEDNGPQVVMEMLNNHVPVVGTRMGGIPDFINERNGYLFNPWVEEDYAALLKWFDCLSVKDVYKLKSQINPTMTTNQHMLQLDDVYSKNVLKSMVLTDEKPQ